MSAADAGDVHLDVMDVANGTASLTRRSSTLDGAVPLRAAQACSPLLAGNACGLQVALHTPWRLHRGRFGGVSVVVDADSDDRRRRHRATWPVLLQRGLVGPSGVWAARFADSPIVVGDGGVVWLFTGLLVRPKRGLFLRTSDAGNRRNRDITVDETFITDTNGFTPLVVAIRAEGVARDIICGGEVATLHVHRAGVSVVRDDIADRQDVAQRHLAFYDAAYFASKKSRPTTDSGPSGPNDHDDSKAWRGAKSLKYRRTIENVADDRTDVDGILHVSEIERAQGTVKRGGTVITADGPTTTSAGLERFEACHQVHTDVRFDGRTVTVNTDDAALQAGARAVQDKLRRVLGDDVVADAAGAIWYLTRLISLHPAGEPFFFSKPWALTQSPVGWSVLIEGARDPAGHFDVLRGVVAGDRFHATPAVFSIWKTTPFSIPVGTPLMCLWARSVARCLVRWCTAALEAS